MSGAFSDAGRQNGAPSATTPGGRGTGIFSEEHPSVRTLAGVPANQAMNMAQHAATRALERLLTQSGRLSESEPGAQLLEVGIFGVAPNNDPRLAAKMACRSPPQAVLRVIQRLALTEAREGASLPGNPCKASSETGEAYEAFVRRVHHALGPELRSVVQGYDWVSATEPHGSPPFLTAKTGDVAGVEAFLRAAVARLEVGVSVNDGTPRAMAACARVLREVLHNGDSLLHVAAYWGKTRVCKMLLARGADIQQCSKNRSSALHYAAWNGQTDTVRFLLGEGGADPSARMQGGDTPLHQAAWRGHAKVCETLLSSRRDARGEQAMKALLFSTKECGSTALHLACGRRQAGVVAALLRFGALERAPTAEFTGLTNIGLKTPLHLCVLSGSVACLHALCDALSQWAARDAEKEGDTTTMAVARVLNMRDSAGESALGYAALQGATGCLRVLLDAAGGATLSAVPEPTMSPNRRPFLASEAPCPPLHNAAKRGHSEAARVLIERHADTDVDARHSADGSTALLCATFYSHLGVMRVLIEGGADPNIGSTRDGVRPLAFAAANGTREAVRLLLDAGAEIDAKELRNGTTALISAAAAARLGVVLVLLERGADVNATLRNGNTALHCAARRGLREVVLMLLEYGARADGANLGGVRPFELARQHGFAEVAAVIEQRVRA